MSNLENKVEDLEERVETLENDKAQAKHQAEVTDSEIIDPEQKSGN